MTAAHSPTPEELMAYLDGELSAAAARDVSTHLAGCERCQQLTDGLRDASRETRAWQVEDAPLSLRLPEETPRSQAPLRPSIWRVARSRTFAVTAAAVVVVVGAFALQLVNNQSSRYALETFDDRGAVGQAAPAIAAGRAAGGGGAAQGPRTAQAETEQRKAGPSIARTVTLKIVTTDFDAARSAIDRTLRDVGGLVGQLGASDPGEVAARSIRGTLRVPAARLDEALAALRTLGRVTSESQQADDVTEQVVDLDVRIANARITEKRLAELIQNRTGRVSDVLEVEREMTRVRTELERLDAQRKNVGQRVAYATVNIEVLEERRASVSLGPVPIPARLRDAISDGFESALSGLLAVALFLLRAGPSIILWATLVGVPAWWALRRIRGIANP